MFKELDSLLDTGKNILFAGAGNVLRNDDGAGVYITRRIKNNSNLSSITVETGIENYIGKINTLNPDILVIVDCADTGALPGSFRLLNINKVQDITFNTHNIAFSRLADFFSMPVYLLAIQPEKIDFGENISYIVRNKADIIINHINQRR
jgi:hydrogenase maturation protease